MLKTYTPVIFDYPLAMCRPGMKFCKNGSFVLFEITPNDQQIQIHGFWKPKSKGILEITLPDDERENYQIEINELNYKC